jgi:uncharacterized protein YqgV (UPF0045/DUF77 family)
MLLSAQVSLYPLRQPNLTPAIEEALDIIRSYGLDVKPGPMSTLVLGEDESLFAALQEAFRHTAGKTQIVMTLAISNACPINK